MGRIRVARDHRLGRAVAIKEVLVNAGELVERFEREARINARLQHPAIMPVYEAGAWPTGEPFFSMRLVSGRSLDDVIAARPTLDDRMALLPNVLAVADAIAYAHTEGVIHRDLKPKNVLVGAFGETVVIDWGLAKDLRDRSPELAAGPYRGGGNALETAVGEIMGTPAYMPPEQANGEPLDERADVYAIGAILYHVLAGRPPVDGKTTAEVLANVLDGNLRPLEETQPGVPPDLLALVGKAMARDASARYPTALELAEDLRRYTTGQLVGAHRYSTGQLVRRWLRRHRTAVAVAAVACIVLAVGGAVSLQRIIAAQQLAEEQRAAAVEQREAALASRGEVEDMLDFMLGDLHTKLRAIGRADVLADSARKAASYYDRKPLEVSPLLIKRSTARRNVAASLLTLGDVPASREQFEAALESAELLVGTWPSAAAFAELAQAQVGLGGIEAVQGKLPAARDWYERALAVRQLTHELAPSDETRTDIAESHGLLANVLNNQGDSRAALQHLATEREIREALLAAAPESDTAQRNLALNLTKSGRILNVRLDPSAVPFIERALALHLANLARKPDSPIIKDDVKETRVWLGRALLQRRKTAEALAHYRAAEPLYKERVAQDPANVSLKTELSRFYEGYADALMKSDVDAALARYQLALDAVAEAALADPTNHEIGSRRAMAYGDMGDAYLQKRDYPNAIKSLRAALAIREKLVGSDATSVADLYLLGSVQEILGDTLLATKQAGEARTMYEAALAGTAKLAAKDPTNVNFQTALAGSHDKLADAHQATGDFAAAIEQRTRALAVLDTLRAANPKADIDFVLATLRVSLGDTYTAARDRDAALKAYADAHAALRADAAAHPDEMARIGPAMKRVDIQASIARRLRAR